MKTKQLILPVAALTVASAALFGLHTVSAQETSTNPMSSLVTKIAQKFNLNESEVQSVFNEHHQDMKNQMKQRLEDSLNEDVKSGKITETQKEAILAKIDELHSQRPDFEKMKNMTPDERKAEMESHRTELENWAKEQGLDPNYLKDKFVFKFHGGMKGHRVMFEEKVN